MQRRQFNTLLSDAGLLGHSRRWHGSLVRDAPGRQQFWQSYQSIRRLT
jgi:hypothetical protein